HERSLCHNDERERGSAERLERPAAEAVLPLDRLVRIGRRPERDRLTKPKVLQLETEDIGEVDLHVDLAVESCAGVAPALRVVLACVAVGTAVSTTGVRVEAPGEIGHALNARERAFDHDLAVVDAA